MQKVIVSLTTIPPRMPYLWQVIKSLMTQSRKPDYIIVNVPERYNNYTNRYTLPDIFRDNIICNICEDFGPATKLLGLYQNNIFQDLSDTDVIIVVDDDRCYNPRLCETFISALENTNNEMVLTVAGWDIDTISGGRITYNSPEKVRGVEYISPGRIDILGGCCGFAMPRRLFPDADENIFRVNQIGYFVDDVWLSGFITKMKTPIYMIPGGIGCDEMRGLNDSISPLADNTRLYKNIECINYFRNKYKIWISKID